MSIGKSGGAVDLATINNSSAAHLIGHTEESLMGRDTLEMQRRLLAKTKTDKVNTLLKKSKQYWLRDCILGYKCLQPFYHVNNKAQQLLYRCV